MSLQAAKPILTAVKVICVPSWTPLHVDNMFIASLCLISEWTECMHKLQTYLIYVSNCMLSHKLQTYLIGVSNHSVCYHNTKYIILQCSVLDHHLWLSVKCSHIGSHVHGQFKRGVLLRITSRSFMASRNTVQTFRLKHGNNKAQNSSFYFPVTQVTGAKGIAFFRCHNPVCVIWGGRFCAN